MAPNTRAGGGPAPPVNTEAGAGNPPDAVPTPANPGIGVTPARPNPADNVPIPVATGIGVAPVRPSNDHPKINSIRDGPMSTQAKEIGSALVLRKKAEWKANFKITKLQ